MKQDKKSAGGSVRFVLLDQIGKPKLQELSDDFLLDQLKNF
jgi:3-dehydroquinate synthase